MSKKLLLLVATVTASLCYGQEPVNENRTNAPIGTVGIKTNLLYDATSTLNLGAEIRLGEKTSLDIPVNYNPWTFEDNRKWKHILIQPEFRLWTSETFRGAFFGLHAHYAYYNVGGLSNPPFSEYMNLHRFEGWLAGAGLSYGYRWNLSHHWGMEATVGVGYAYLSYDKYPCHTCGEKIANETKNYFGPTKAGITLIYNIGGKKKAKAEPIPVVAPVVIPIPEPEPAPKVIYEPKLMASYIVPEVEQVKIRSDAGKAYLDFTAGKSVILSDFKNNASELDKIHELIKAVKNDSYSTITGIVITGYASPEGSYQSNLVLSEKRAHALKQQIKAIYGFNENLFMVQGKGEDWQTLDSLVYQSNLSDKYEILSIIRGTDVMMGREKKLMDLSSGVPYKKMLADFFPGLRRLEYELRYTVLPFTVEQGKEVFKTKPSSLSLNEIFLIAQTYEKGSHEFNEVFETAARIFPQSDIANLNAAASALSRKDTVAATGYLNKIKNYNAAYYNNRGMLSFLEGNKEKATDYFIKATGSTEATHNSNEVNKQ